MLISKRGASLLANRSPQKTRSRVTASIRGGVADLKTTLAMSSADMKASFARAGAIAAKFKSAGAKA
jgi:hypothetical protein